MLIGSKTLKQTAEKCHLMETLINQLLADQEKTNATIRMYEEKTNATVRMYEENVRMQAQEIQELK